MSSCGVPRRLVGTRIRVRRSGKTAASARRGRRCLHLSERYARTKRVRQDERLERRSFRTASRSRPLSVGRLVAFNPCQPLTPPNDICFIRRGWIMGACHKAKKATGTQRWNGKACGNRTHQVRYRSECRLYRWHRLREPWHNIGLSRWKIARHAAICGVGMLHVYFLLVAHHGGNNLRT